jgi:N-acetylglucosaminyldiphosphoundecaprenol N-acetyl-beta-D-mannosaminyltransferase
MPIVAVILGVAALVWGAVYARRGSLLIGSGVFLAVAYVFGHEFWKANVGPLPLTLDRLVLAALLAALAIQWRIGRFKLRPFTGSDLALLALLSLLVTSAAMSGQPEVDGATSKWGRLVTSFLIPGVLYFIVRHAAIKPRDWVWLLTGFAALGTYLGLTAVLEIAGGWPFVFPRYIADPNLGIHFGRARGPELNSASLGLTLSLCFWCAWTLLGQTARRWQQLAIVVALPIMACGVFFTYTRSTWLGLIASGLIVAALQIPPRWRLPTLAAAALGGVLIVAGSWSQLVGLKREGTAAESLHSVGQRTSFAYVSWQMFRDHPLWGVGFGRFYDRKLPYLSDRSQEFELESLRHLHHHNTLLSLLTETGLFGLGTYLALMIVWARQAWQLARHRKPKWWFHAQGILMLALLTNYLCSAVFHDLTLIPSQHWFLFVFAALTVSLWQDQMEPSTQNCCSRHPESTRDCEMREAIRRPPSVLVNPQVQLFGMQISRITMSEAVDRLLDWCNRPRSEACRYVVTPNVDHAVLFQHRADLRAAYADASLVLADGAPIVLAAQLLGRDLPERVAGSDLVPRLFDACKPPLRVFLLGAAAGVADVAATRIKLRWQGIQVVGTYSPPIGFENDHAENARILARVSAAAPDLLIIGFGAPKQELWVHRHRYQIQAKVAVCAGATIDFLAGNKRRSPAWMRRVGLEWLHRVWTEPRRLAARYARDAWVFPQLVWREWREMQA